MVVLKKLWVVGVILLVGCTTSPSGARLHSVSMYNAGGPAYDFRIDYGGVVLPYGPNGDDEFAAGGGSTPILRTLPLSPILGKRSVYVQAQALQPGVQARAG